MGRTGHLAEFVLPALKAHAQWGQVLYKHASPVHLEVLLLIQPLSLAKSEIPLLQII